MSRVVGGPYGYPGDVGRPSRMSGSGRKALPDVPEWWEALLVVRQLSGGPSKCPGVVWRPSRMSGMGREALPGCPVVVGMPPG